MKIKINNDVFLKNSKHVKFEGKKKGNHPNFS